MAEYPVSEYSEENLPERFDEMSEERKYFLLAWIAQNLIPRDTFNGHHSSYGLKHLIKNEYYTNGEFKGAMKKLGYKIKDENELNWVFNISSSSPALKQTL